jgi:hypothetical protein
MPEKLNIWVNWKPNKKYLRWLIRSRDKFFGQTSLKEKNRCIYEFKGTVAGDFLPLFFSSIEPTWTSDSYPKMSQIQILSLTHHCIIQR